MLNRVEYAGSSGGSGYVDYDQVAFDTEEIVVESSESGSLEDIREELETLRSQFNIFLASLQNSYIRVTQSAQENNVQGSINLDKLEACEGSLFTDVSKGIKCIADADNVKFTYYVYTGHVNTACNIAYNSTISLMVNGTAVKTDKISGCGGTRASLTKDVAVDLKAGDIITLNHTFTSANNDAVFVSGSYLTASTKL